VDAGGEAASEGLRVSPMTTTDARTSAFVRILGLLSPQRQASVRFGTRSVKASRSQSARPHYRDQTALYSGKQ
jgi:hypothetical protein